ncbi:MAG: gliding motility-associated C-terminal domain-containing protein [Saprospiraceae bacterium]
MKSLLVLFIFIYFNPNTTNGQDTIPKPFFVNLNPDNLCVNATYSLSTIYDPDTMANYIDSVEVKNIYLFGDKWINLTNPIDYFVKDTIFDVEILTGTSYRVYFKDLIPKVFKISTPSSPVIFNCHLGDLSLTIADTICKDRLVDIDFLLPKIEDQYDGSKNGTPRNWQWKLPGTDVGYSNLPDPGPLQFLSAGTYTMSLTVSNQVDTVTATKDITVLDAPIVNRPDYEEIILRAGEDAILQPCGSAAIYRWPDITQLSCFDCPSPILRTDEPMELELLLSGGNALCDTTCRYQIRIDREDRVFIPNAFSPNDDGNNDTWSAFTPDLELISYEIYDRWGGLIWSDQSPSAAWDGYAKGKKAEKGVYVYSIRYQRKLNGQMGYLTGSLTLVR